jgi:hypothetical protein
MPISGSQSGAASTAARTFAGRITPQNRRHFGGAYATPLIEIISYLLVDRPMETHQRGSTMTLNKTPLPIFGGLLAASI